MGLDQHGMNSLALLDPSS